MFRRQPDGTLVNADLTEEIARREERRKAKIARELAKEEKRKERLKAKEERLKAIEARRQEAKEAKRKEKEANSKNKSVHRKQRTQHNKEHSENTIPKAVNMKSQPFVSAPTPAVSAWEASKCNNYVYFIILYLILTDIMFRPSS